MADKIHKGRTGGEIKRTVSTDATAANELIAKGQVEQIALAKTAEIQAVWTGTQADYDLLTPVATTLYFIQ